MKIGRLGADIGRCIAAEALLETPHEGGIGLAFDPFEIAGRRDMVLADIEPHRPQLGFGRGQAGDRHALRVEARVGIGLIEEARSATHHGREDDVGSGLLDVAHDRQEIPLPRLDVEVAFRHHDAAGARQELPDEPVGLPRIDVVRPDQVEARPVGLHQVAAKLDAVLIGSRARVDDVGRKLEALVGRRIPEKTIETLDHRHDGLPARRRVAAEDRRHPVFHHQLLGEIGIGNGPRSRVVDNW